MKTDPCADCGSTTHVASMVVDGGARTCAACLIGLTPLVRAGIPIAKTPGELAREGGTVSPARRVPR